MVRFPALSQIITLFFLPDQDIIEKKFVIIIAHFDNSSDT